MASAMLLLLGLVGCGTQAAYVPEAVVILNPTPGAPSIYSAQVVTAPGPPVAPVPPIAPLPPYPPGPPPTGCQTIHVVQPGETVSGIAVRYNVPGQAISYVNRLRNPNLIFVGQGLCIPNPPAPGPWPTAWPTPTRVPAGPTPTRAPATPTVIFATATPSGNVCRPTYLVQPGDTVYSIATKCNVSADQLIAVNGLQPPYTLVPGEQRLVMPPPS